ncbi:MAG: hypothetical protein ACP5PW_01490 [Candidatus Dormibacteria bacterium]
MSPVDVGATEFAISRLILRLDSATNEAVARSAENVRAKAAALAPKGTPGNSTDPPGRLGQSILVTGPAGGGGEYRAFVGPTTVYGRQRELGGPIFPKVAAALVFTKFGTVYRVAMVKQRPEPYLRPATLEAMLVMHNIFTEAVRVALLAPGA